MALTTAGRNAMASRLISDSTTSEYDETNAYIGVGDSSTAFAVGQTDLQAASNKVRVGMDSTYPQIASNVITFKATFGTSVANWAWNEWAVFNASTSGTMLNRLVENNGTKVAGQTWVFTATITINIGS